MKAKRWLAVFLILSFAAFLCAAALTAWVDPFFHYHAPHTDRFFYPIDNQRSQNDGILRHFDYDAVITGSSMIVNFKTSELDALFGTHAVKVPAEGATYYEIGGLIDTALENQPKVKTVFRSIDRHMLLYGTNGLRSDLGEYPSYLYDRSIWNDYKYLLNADILFGRTARMLTQAAGTGFVPGITSFDAYANTMKEYEGSFGLPAIETLCWFEPGTVGEPVHLSDFLRENLVRNIEDNVVAAARAHPDVTFYCFFPPYSLGYWSDQVASGEIYALFEGMQTAAGLMLECDNIRLYDFDGRRDIIGDVNNYRDLMHYGEWINSLMLKWMHDGDGRLTRENYRERLEEDLEYFLQADFPGLSAQERYHCDYYAAALLNEELTGAVPRKLGREELLEGELRSARLEPDGEDGALVLHCTGALGREPETDLAAYLRDCDYIGLKLRIPDAGTWSYLCFEGRNTALNGQPAVFVYDADGKLLSSMEKQYQDLLGGWQRFAVDLRGAAGPVEVIFQGGYPDSTGHDASAFAFRGFALY
ncbi:MAG: hypothetical protein Q4E45_10920 [Eubacteriales bacterium]|nr:hypothetical protein [Eubacteriales bacterium]